jgi:hypothetical protein
MLKNLLRDKFIAEMKSQYPAASARLNLENSISPTFISPMTLQLPKYLLLEAAQTIQEYFKLRDKPVAAIESQGWSDPGHNSVLMSYDFHLEPTASGWQLRLIEINTNASMGLAGALLYKAAEIEPNPLANPKSDILRSFKMEYDSWTKSQASGWLNELAIIDENPSQQRLLFEFEMYREVFQNHGWNCEMLDPKDLLPADLGRLRAPGRSEPLHMVYNRWTDFLLEKPEAKLLRDSALANKICVTPHPFEYLRLADKNRMVDWTRAKEQGELAEPIAKSLISSKLVSEFQAEELWAHRKKYFFKPVRMHGGKAVYRGSSMSQVVFKRILESQYIAQEIIAAPELQAPSEAGGQNFKYDLRFVAYRDQIQLCLARLYQGQMTNAQTEGGGLAVISWSEPDIGPTLKLSI